MVLLLILILVSAYEPYNMVHIVLHFNIMFDWYMPRLDQKYLDRKTQSTDEQFELFFDIMFQLILKKLACNQTSNSNEVSENNSKTDEFQGFTDQASLLYAIFNAKKGPVDPLWGRHKLSYRNFRVRKSNCLFDCENLETFQC